VINKRNVKTKRKVLTEDFLRILLVFIGEDLSGAIYITYPKKNYFIKNRILDELLALLPRKPFFS